MRNYCDCNKNKDCRPRSCVDGVMFVLWLAVTFVIGLIIGALLTLMVMSNAVMLAVLLVTLFALIVLRTLMFGRKV